MTNPYNKYKMAVLFRIAILLLFWNVSMAQQYFNVASDWPAFYIQTGDIVEIHKGYIISGTMVDTQYNYFGYFIATIDTEGITTEFKTYVKEGRHTQAYFSPIMQINDTTFIRGAVGWYPPRLILFQFNNMADTILTKEYPSIYSDSVSFHSLNDLIKLSDGGFATTSGQKWYDHSELNAEMTVYRFDADLNMLWGKVIGGDYRHQSGAALLENDTGGIIVFGRDSYGPDPNFGDTIVRPLYIVELDESGNIIREKKHSNELRALDFEVVKAPDGGYLLCSSRVRDLRFANGSPGNLVADPTILKMDQDFNYVWEKQVGGKISTGDTGYSSMVPSPDGVGVVAAGTTTDTMEGMAKNYGVITKVTWDGDSLWSRYYRLETAPYPISNYSHYVWAINTCADGGYIVSGDIYFNIDFEIFPYRQQTWSLKLDEYGCLTPGCQLPSGTEDSKGGQPDEVMYIYPNPGNQTVYIQTELPQAISKWDLQVYDMQGKPVFRNTYTLPELTVAMDVSEWPDGHYIFQIVHKSIILAREGFVKVD